LETLDTPFFDNELHNEKSFETTDKMPALNGAVSRKRALPRADSFCGIENFILSRASEVESPPDAKPLDRYPPVLCIGYSETFTPEILTKITRLQW
jgi:hypothetical protein